MRCRSDIESLNAPFLAIVDSLIPAEEEKAKQNQLVALLKKLISKEWPEAQLHLYGSCANSFGVSHSDIDLCLAIGDSDINKSEVLLKLADILQSDNLQNVQVNQNALPIAVICLVHFREASFVEIPYIRLRFILCFGKQTIRHALPILSMC